MPCIFSSRLLYLRWPLPLPTVFPYREGVKLRQHTRLMGESHAYITLLFIPATVGTCRMTALYYGWADCTAVLSV